MKKFLLIFCLINFPWCSPAMDNDSVGGSLIAYKQERAGKKFDMTACVRNIKRHEHFLFIPFKDIAASFYALPSKKQQKIKKALADCPLFAIKMLPEELCHIIISKAFDEICYKKVSCMPLINVYELYDEIRQKIPVAIGDREISIHELFACNVEKRNQLIKIGNPSLSARLIGSNTERITEDDYAVLTQMKLDGDIQANMRVSVLPQESSKVFAEAYVKMILAVVMGSAVFGYVMTNDVGLDVTIIACGITATMLLVGRYDTTCVHAEYTATDRKKYI